MNARPRHATPPWIIVAKREVIAQLSDKAFWIGTLTTLGLVALGLLFTGLMGNDGADRVAVDSDEGAQIVASANNELRSLEPLRLSADEALTAVEDGDVVGFLSSADGGGWTLTVTNLMDSPDLSGAVRQHQIAVNAEALGADMGALTADTNLTLVTLEEEEGQGVAVMVATLAFAVLFMLAAITYGMQIASSVVTEKESRIVEILAAAIPTRQLLLGKIVGSTVMALGQVILIATVALVGLSLTQWSVFVGMIAPVAGWFVVFFLVGFASLACLWAGAGHWRPACRI